MEGMWQYVVKVSKNTRSMNTNEPFLSQFTRNFVSFVSYGFKFMIYWNSLMFRQKFKFYSSNQSSLNLWRTNLIYGETKTRRTFTRDVIILLSSKIFLARFQEKMCFCKSVGVRPSICVSYKNRTDGNWTGLKMTITVASRSRMTFKI